MVMHVIDYMYPNVIGPIRLNVEKVSMDSLADSP